MTVLDPYVPHRGDPSYAVLHYDLELDYRPATNALSGTAVLTVRALAELQSLELDLVGLEVFTVTVVGQEAVRYRHRGGRLAVTLPQPVATGGRLSLRIRYGGKPVPQRGPWGEVGWEELTDGALVASQPDGAPTWFPCNDHPADKAGYRISVTTGSGYVVVANGALTDRRTGGSRTTWTYVQAEPTSTYLVTVQIGRYALHEIAAGPVRQLLVHPPRLGAPAVADTARQPQMMTLFTELFGPYPFVDYTVVVTDDDLEIPLEAQGMSTFGANHVDGRGGSERLVAHELAHQWFGNSLTVAAWRHVWLNEGFACYAEWLWSEAAGGPSAQECSRHAHARLVGLPQDLVLSDPGPQRMFDDRVYQRGALTLDALRRFAGDEVFFVLLRDWAAQHRHGLVTTEQFVAHCAQYAGPRAGELLTAWLDRPELPAR